MNSDVKFVTNEFIPPYSIVVGSKLYDEMKKDFKTIFSDNLSCINEGSFSLISIIKSDYILDDYVMLGKGLIKKEEGDEDKRKV